MPAGSLLGALAAPRPRGLLRPEPSSRAGGFYPRGSCRCSVDNQQKRHGHSIAPLDEAAALRPNCRPCANLDHGQRLASCSEQRLGFGCGVSTASITLRWLARSSSSYGDPTPPVTNCVPAHAVLVVAEKVRHSNVQAGPAITSASIRFQPVSATKANSAAETVPSSRTQP